MILSDIISIIDYHYPIKLAYEWDNPGLLLGDSKKNINKILVTLDVTEQVLKQAIDENADLILSHHPLIFSGIKQINDSEQCGRLILSACENKIAVFAAHTNMDCAPEGINSRLCKMLSINEIEIIEENKFFPGCGLGRIGNIKKTTLRDFMDTVKKCLNTSFLRYSGNPSQIIKRVAIGSGSCADLIPESIKKGADVIITGDLKYHTCLELTNNKFSIIDAGHFPTEQIVKDMFVEILENTGLEIIKSAQKDIFNII